MEPKLVDGRSTNISSFSEKFNLTMTCHSKKSLDLEKPVWKSFEGVVAKFLGNLKIDSY